MNESIAEKFKTFEAQLTQKFSKIVFSDILQSGKATLRQVLEKKGSPMQTKSLANYWII